MGLLVSKVMEEAWIFWGPRIRHFAKKKSQQHGQGTVWTFFFKKLPHFKEEIYEMAKLLGRFGLKGRAIHGENLRNLYIWF